MNVLSQLEPSCVFKYFEMLSDIPRGSGREEKVSNWLVSFARERNLWVYQDEYYNVLIKKEGTKEYENAPSVILHGHMDMVCKSDPGVEHDFENSGLDLYIKDGYIHANGTTLGADNGIGIAYFLALLDSDDIPHPPLEVILTVMEEMGKVGGNAFDTGLLTGKRMLDLNYHEDKILAGCSGDVSVDFRIPLLYEKPNGSKTYRLSISQLKGGHCEFDIVLGRGNSILILARMMNDILAQTHAQFCDLNGGVQNNVIPAEAELLIVIDPDEEMLLKSIVEESSKQIKYEYSLTDPDIMLTLTETENIPENVYSSETSRMFAKSLPLIPHGVISMNFKTPGICETSNNIGLLREDSDELSVISTITGAVSSKKHEVLRQIIDLASLIGHGVHAAQFGTDAPEWPYNPDSVMLKKAKDAFLNASGYESEIVIMPASLELGLFGSRIDGLDIVSIGTETHGVHSPSEELRIESVGIIWKTVKELMKSLKE